MGQVKTKGADAIREMTDGPVFRQLIVFALPLMLANMCQTFYSMVDTAVVGNFLGAEELAAVSITCDLVTFYTMLCVGFASGAQVVIGQYVGKKDIRSVEQTIGTLFTFSGILAVCSTVVCFVWADWQLNLINMPEASMDAARVYFLTCAMGMLFIFGYNCVGAVLRGMGDSKRPLIFVVVASVSNLILDLLFVLVFNWGVFGVALATVMGQAFSFVASMVYLYRHQEQFHFRFAAADFVPDPRQLKLLLRLGVPQAIQFAAVLVSVLYVSACINTYGVAAAAVHGVASKLENILRIICNSMCTAGCTFVAQNMGAGRTDRVKTCIYHIMVVTVVYTALCSVALYCMPIRIFSLFSQDQAVLANATLYVLPGIVVYMGHGFRAPFSTVYNGVGNARLSLISGLLDGVVARIGLALLLGNIMGMGLAGYWYGSALAGYVAAVIGGVYFFSGRWKTYQLLK